MSVFRVSKKVIKLLSEHQRQRLIGLIILMIVGGILETCSVGLVVPFMDAVVNFVEKFFNKKVHP